MKEIHIGIDLGGTNIKLGCFQADLRLLCKSSVSTKGDIGPEGIVDLIYQSTDELLKKNNLSPDSISAIGIGAPGPADLNEGIIIASPNIPSFRNVPLRKMISEKFSKPVVLENDANAACMGEFVAGAGKDINNMVFFTLGTGIGGGIIIDGKLIHGCDDNAAELGHIIIHPGGRKCGCGQNGCAEAYASASATAKRAEEAVNSGAQSALTEVLKKNGKITCEDVYDQLKAGDKLAKKITDETAKTLALLCIDVLHTTEPQRIVFAGGMIAAGDILLKTIKGYFNEYIWDLKKEKVEIAFATLGEDAGITGAASLAKQIKFKTL